LIAASRWRARNAVGGWGMTDGVGNGDLPGMFVNFRKLVIACFAL
jgi:hypothetical protein